MSYILINAMVMITARLYMRPVLIEYNIVINESLNTTTCQLFATCTYTSEYYDVNSRIYNQLRNSLKCRPDYHE